jgi:hypothetical protein
MFILKISDMLKFKFSCYRPDPPQPTVQEYVPTSPPLRSSHTQQNYTQYSAYPNFPAYDDEVELYRDVGKNFDVSNYLLEFNPTFRLIWRVE